MPQRPDATATDIQDVVRTSYRTRRPRVLLVTAGPGCGRTTLLDLLARRTDAAGGQVLRAAARPHAGPWQVLRELTGGRAEFARSLALAEDRAWHPDTAAAAFRADLDALARSGPVLLCVDDVRRADPQSLAQLRALARRMPAGPVVLVATAAGHDTRWEELFTLPVLRRPYVERARLALLTTADVERILRAERHVDGPDVPRAAARLHRLSGGNPGLLRALLAENAAFQHPSCDGPFARAVGDCLHACGPEAVAVARALAVLGDRPLDASLLEAMVDGAAPAALAGLAALRGSGLLDGLGRREPAVRAAALAGHDLRSRTRQWWRAAHALRAVRATPSEVAAPLLALMADDPGERPRDRDLELMSCVAQDLFEQAHGLREGGDGARGITLHQAARRLAQCAGAAAAREPRTLREPKALRGQGPGMPGIAHARAVELAG
ncbi:MULTISPECIES: ATP-binding protein [unclassified Streptomyces]|uniref:ATP-binding protein n=1 Tax=unclassified Streptomyces TaxID=2593676 RepID=UPI000DBA4E19|nr:MULTISPECIES: ATP-binding protein [unclassified Streptomyces]MYT69735.1 AAA family ATPase [Streptomyces sp. SID8367]RAJ69368.1 AAA ATPase-like protein [Streptomyces sp. PsTaAH-137]